MSRKASLLRAASPFWMFMASITPAYVQDASSPQIEAATQRVGSGVIAGRVVEPAASEYLRSANIRIVRVQHRNTESSVIQRI